MATVRLLLPGAPKIMAHQQVTIVTTDGRSTFTVPLLREVGLSNLAARWAVIDRPGREPLTVFAGRNAAKAAATIVVGGEDLATSAEVDLGRLGNLAKGRQPVVVSLGRLNRWSATGTWVITDMGVDATAHVQGTNDIARAEVTLELTAAFTPEQVKAQG